MSPSTSSASMFFFFFNDTATTEIYTLSLHDALPIYYLETGVWSQVAIQEARRWCQVNLAATGARSEEHTSELQSLAYLVCRLLLEKKKKQNMGIKALPTHPVRLEAVRVPAVWQPGSV